MFIDQRKECEYSPCLSPFLNLQTALIILVFSFSCNLQFSRPANFALSIGLESTPKRMRPVLINHAKNVLLRRSRRRDELLVRRGAHVGQTIVLTRLPLDLLMMLHSPSSQTHPRRRACHGATGTICATPAVAVGDANTAVSPASCLHRATSLSRSHDNWGAEGTKEVLVLQHRRAALVLQVVIEGMRSTKRGLVS